MTPNFYGWLALALLCATLLSAILHDTDAFESALLLAFVLIILRGFANKIE